MSSGLLTQALVYLAAAVISVPIAKRLGFGSVLGYLMAGVLIGPHLLGLVGGEGGDVMHFAEFGVVMMLFLIGLELKPAVLWQLRTPILGLGGLQLLLTTLAVGGAALAFGLAWKPSLALGLILALSSTAIVLQSLQEKGLDKSPGGQASFSVLLFQDMAVIPIIALLPLLASGAGQHAEGAHAHGGALEGLPPWLHAMAVLGAIAIVVLGGRFLSRPMFRFIAGSRLPEVFTAAALLLVVGITLLMQIVGLSPALGAFLAGVVLAENEYRHELESDIEPFKGLLLGLFFISVGASIDFPYIASHPGIVAGIVAGVLVLKATVLLVLSRMFKLKFSQGLLLALGLCQTGEFAFVLLSLAGQQNILPGDLIRSLVAAVALTMVATPPLFILLEKVLLPRFRDGGQAAPMDSIPDEETPVILAGFGRVGNAVGRILRAQGVATTVLDLDPKLVDAVRRVGLKAYYGDASRLDLLHAAGAAKGKLLILAIDNPEKTLEIAKTVREHFPNLRILSRTQGRVDSYEMLNLGFNDIFRETQGTALEMGFEALRCLGFRSHQAHRTVQVFRRHNDKAMRELAAHWGNRKTYLHMLREKIEEAEALLRESGKLSEEVDKGWDNESRRVAAALSAQQVSAKEPADKPPVAKA